MLIFAYGSSLDFKQTRARCPSAKFVAKALLKDHRLCFPRCGSKRGCGVASVECARGDHVWGVVYDIADEDVPKMDKCEGFDPNRSQNSYNRAQIIVLSDGNAATPMTVVTYIAEPQENPPLPNANYRDTIVCGARAWKLPDDYVKRFEAIKIS
jgi:gamma-glutamylcyclotransferase